MRAFLWVLLGVVLAAFALNVALLGSAVLSFDSLFPNLAFLAMLGAGLTLSRRGNHALAVWMIVGVTLLAGVLGVVAEGAASGGPYLIFLLPLVLAALLLGRRALLITAGVTLTAVLLAPLAQRAATFAPSGEAGGPWAGALQFTVVYVTVAFLLDRFGVVFMDTLRASVEHELELNAQIMRRLQTREALLEGRRLNDAIVGNLPGIFFIMDQQGRFFRLNRNVADELGYSQMLRRRVGLADVVRPEELGRVRALIEQVFTAGDAADQVTLLARDGRPVPYFVRATRVNIKGADYLMGIGVDRSEIDEVQARVQLLNVELEERLERITALREIDSAMTANVDLDETLRVVLQQVMQRLQIDAASILLFRSGSQTLRYGAGRGLRADALRRTNLRVGEGLAGRAALTREPLTLTGRAELARAFAGASSLQHEEFEFYMAVPLVSTGSLQGVLELFNYTQFEPSHDWTDFLTALATQAALAIDAARLVDSLETTNQELLLAYDTTIEGWARALDLKDEDTEGHSRRVTELTVRLARRLGMSEGELVHVRRGALLHDIGKMGIPDHILRKPGALDEAEWELMKQHTVFARDFLAPIPFLGPALVIPYSHHEKFDGSGYPLGLAGEEIPLAARLFAVVDVYDALTSDRPYRKAWSRQRALEHIAAQAGSHFDPRVVREFLELMRGEERALAAQEG